MLKLKQLPCNVCKPTLVQWRGNEAQLTRWGEERSGPTPPIFVQQRCVAVLLVENLARGGVGAASLSFYRALSCAGCCCAKALIRPTFVSVPILVAALEQRPRGPSASGA